MQTNLDTQVKRSGVFLRMPEEDTVERVSVTALSHWAEHFGIKQTEYIHRALREKMERDATALREALQSTKTNKARARAPAKLPPLAARWLTPDETAQVKVQQTERFGKRHFKIQPDSFFAQFAN